MSQPECYRNAWQSIHIWSHFVVGILLRSSSPTVTFCELLETCTVATVATSEHRLWIGRCKSCSEVVNSSHGKVLKSVMTACHIPYLSRSTVILQWESRSCVTLKCHVVMNETVHSTKIKRLVVSCHRSSSWCQPLIVKSRVKSVSAFHIKRIIIFS
jgi:hypothetical protein